MESATINKLFTDRYNEIYTKYTAADENDEEALDDCIKQAHALLLEPAIPRYHRIKTWLLLASMVGDIEEALMYHNKADILLRVVRSHEVTGATIPACVEATLNKLGEEVEELREILTREAAAEDRSNAISAQETKNIAAAEREQEKNDYLDADILGFPTNEAGVALIHILKRIHSAFLAFAGSIRRCCRCTSQM